MKTLLVIVALLLLIGVMSAAMYMLIVMGQIIVETEDCARIGKEDEAARKIKDGRNKPDTEQDTTSGGWQEQMESTFLADSRL